MNKRVSTMILYIVVILLIIGEIAESVGRCLNSTEIFSVLLSIRNLLK